MKHFLPIFVLSFASACSLAPGEDRPFNPDEVFSKLDQPEVASVSETLLENALAAEKKGNYPRAISFYKQLLDSDGENVDYALNLGRNLRKSGEYGAAEQIYSQILEKKPDSIEALEGRGLAVMSLGEFKQAGKIFAQVMAKDAKRWKTLNALGVLFATKSMFDEADAYFNEGLNYSANNPAVLNNMALAQAMAQRYGEAVRTGKRAASKAQSSTQRKQIELNLALIHAAGGDLMGAEKVAAKYYEGAQLKNNMGLYAYLANDDALAKGYLNSALAGSSEYYQRAWDNLNALNQTSERDELVAE